MRIPTVLNDLSLRRKAQTIPSAREAIAALVQLLARATSWGGDPMLVVTGDLLGVELCPDGYTVAEWSGDPEVYFAVRQVFLTAAAALPLQERWAADLVETYHNVLGDFEGEQALALSAAAVANGLALSAPTEVRWDSNTLTLTLLSNDFDESQATVYHASAPSHLSENDSWKISRFVSFARSGKDVWNAREVWFPGLSFCPGVEADLDRFTSSDDILATIIRRLCQLSIAASAWTDGAFPLDSLPGRARRESSTTLNRFGDDRTRLCPDGRAHRFSLHVSGAAGTRLYFETQPSVKQLLIGLIVPHLQTAKFA